MLLTKIVTIRWCANTKKWYQSKGYIFTKMGDKFEVKVKDLTKGSAVLVDVQCNGCGKVLRNVIWYNYLGSVHEDGRCYCQRCANTLSKRYGNYRTELDMYLLSKKDSELYRMNNKLFLEV